MVKRLIFCVIICAINFAYADWIDDLVGNADTHFNMKRAVSVIEPYIQKDKKDIADYEKRMKDAEHDKGAMALVHNGASNVQLSNAKVSLKYHEKVLHYLQDLMDNKNDRESFISRIKDIKVNVAELERLHKELGVAKDLLEKAKLGTLIALENTKIKGTKAKVDCSVLAT